MICGTKTVIKMDVNNDKDASGRTHSISGKNRDLMDMHDEQRKQLSDYKKKLDKEEKEKGDVREYIRNWKRVKQEQKNYKDTSTVRAANKEKGKNKYIESIDKANQGFSSDEGTNTIETIEKEDNTDTRKWIGEYAEVKQGQSGYEDMSDSLESKADTQNAGKGEDEYTEAIDPIENEDNADAGKLVGEFTKVKQEQSGYEDKSNSLESKADTQNARKRDVNVILKDAADKLPYDYALDILSRC